MLRGSQGGRLAPGQQQSSTHQAEARLRSGPPIWGTLGMGDQATLEMGGAGDVGCGVRPLCSGEAAVAMRGCGHAG